MEEIFKIYNDGNHFVGTKYSRLSYDVNKNSLSRRKKLNKGKVYDSKEFLSECKTIKSKWRFKKHSTLKECEDYIKSLISKYSFSDYSLVEIDQLVINDFVKEYGDIVFYVEKGKSKAEDSNKFVKSVLNKFGKNLKERVRRFRRKAYNNKWNYFVTLTYDPSLHSEESFKDKIKKKLSNLHTRKNWLYMGVFERSSIGRLHFHGLFYIPEDEMIGEINQISDYSLEHHKRQTRNENSIFRSQFGINDFESLGKEDLTKSNVLNYILKYIGKTGEPIFYSRGIKTFIYIKFNDRADFITKMVNYMSIRYVLFDDCLANSIEVSVKRMNC